MGLYNFQSRFVPHILDWSKRHTIRAQRKTQDCPGAVMHLYTGLRHPGAQLLMRALCVRSEYIHIEGGPQQRHRIGVGMSLGFLEGSPGPIYGSETGGPLIWLAEDELHTLAWRDGFRPEGSTLEKPGDSFGLMMQFWTGRLPFEGQIAHWDPARQWAKDGFGIWRWMKAADPAVTAQLQEAS